MQESYPYFLKRLVMKNKVAIILGTRPEAIKLIPIYLEMKKSDIFIPVLISTGQHSEMLKQIFLFFEIKPDIELNVMTKNQTLASLTGALFINLENIFKENIFNFTCVQGDTTTAFVAAMSSFYYNVKVIHIEAGLRTNDKKLPFPEELNRQMIGKIADIHFTPTKNATFNLMKENIINNVAEVGNPVIDSLFLAKEKIYNNILDYEKKFMSLIDKKKKLILVTGHRRENFGKGFEEICNTLGYIAERYEKIEIIYPVHLNPNVQEVVYRKLNKYDNIHLLSPLSYDELIYIMSKSWLVMTDSGGIQEEAPSLDIPVIVMRNKTERVESIEAGCSVLGGTTMLSILKQFNMIFNSLTIYENMKNKINPYGQGNASKKIVDYLKNIAK